MTTAFAAAWLIIPIALFTVGFSAICHLFYNILLHPLRSYPGPLYAKATIFWFLYHTFKGDYHVAIHRLHLIYGPVVRVAPNELSYEDPQAFKEIYGHRGNNPEMIKDPSQIFGEDPRYPNISIAPREEHSRLRRLLSNSFSDKSIREQEPIMLSYVKLLIERLHQNCAEPVDMARWYNFTTFDIIGHLTFAEPFDCLSNSNYHPWVGYFLSVIKKVTWLRALNRLSPRATPYLMRLIPKRIQRENKAHLDMSKEKLIRRREKTLEYTDFLSIMIAAEKNGSVEFGDLLSNVPILIIAGSETTATSLSGTTYYLSQNPRVYALLVKEIRTAFQTPDDITISRTSDLKYLLAVIDESLRLYSPTVTNHPRLTPPGGATIAGKFVPGNSIVGINYYGTSRSSMNFSRPEEFIPERFLEPENPEWHKDKRDALQPFSLGPRNCIGRNLAIVEMRLILAHILLEFDLEVTSESEDWLNQRGFSVWEKKPLMVRLRPVKRT